MSVLPVGLSKDDSILFAEHYIRSWAEEILLYEKAANNIPDNVDVDKLVENYRKALIMHTYQQELINQKLTNDISEQEIAEYYGKNKELFKLETPLIKGLFIKVPLTAPQLNNVRRWYKTDKQDAVESLEKYSLQNAVKYEYFYNKWVSGYGCSGPDSIESRASPEAICRQAPTCGTERYGILLFPQCERLSRGR